MDPLISSPAVLLHHDGELADVRQLLEELGAHFVERLGPGRWEEAAAGYDVIIASPRHILNFPPPTPGTRRTLIAVIEGDSRTLRAHLSRMAVDMMVRRPVHPAALRLLILHTLYRGPERRGRQRVTIGAEVRFHVGLLRRSATLTDISRRGCRLLCGKPVQRDKTIKLHVPASVTRGRSLKLSGTVLRSGPAINEPPGISVMAVRFHSMTPTRADQLEQILEAHQTGPAVLTQPPEQANDRARPEKTSPQAPDAKPEEEYLALTNDPAGQCETETPAPVERRAAERHAYSKRVVALGEQATRVLLGRDISIGGMRVDSNSCLAVGDRLQIALHAVARSEPLVVRARVQRKDDDQGLVLCFDDLSEDESAELAKLINHLPVLTADSSDDQSEESGVIISEVLDRQAG